MAAVITGQSLHAFTFMFDLNVVDLLVVGARLTRRLFWIYIQIKVKRLSVVHIVRLGDVR